MRFGIRLVVVATRTTGLPVETQRRGAVYDINARICLRYTILFMLDDTLPIACCGAAEKRTYHPAGASAVV